MRVVSLVPAATEILCHIGGASLLVGRSHECDHPHAITSAPALTRQTTNPDDAPDLIDQHVAQAMSSGQSLYRLDIERLQDLRPDVILTQDLCNVCSIDLNTVRAAAARMSPPPAVVTLNPQTYEDVLDDLIKVGRAVGLEESARNALIALRERFFRAADHVNSFAAHPSVVFLEWTDPLYVGGHWTPQLIERAGATHPLNPTTPMEGAGAGAGGQMAHRTASKSIRVQPEQLERADPDAIIICPCGVALDAIPAHLSRITSTRWWPTLRAVRNSRVALVDGNHMFNRPGPRLVDAYEWLVGWLNDRPELIPHDFPWRPL